MQQFLRFSLSGLAGIIITAALFLGMVKLLSNPSQRATTPDLNVEFSFVREFKAPEQTPPKKNTKPELKKAEHPPNAPAAPQSPSTPREDLVAISHGTQAQPNLIAGIGLPGIPGGHGATTPQNGGLESGFAPPYPSQPLMNRTEGWVEVLIDVNEFGRVSQVTVLNSKPRRVFDQTTIRTVKKWKFYPKIVNGSGTPYQVKQTIEFTLDQ